MTRPRKLLSAPAGATGRAIAAEQLKRWLAAERKLAGRQGPTSLHDFRVALRRLRSTVRAFRPFLQHPKGLRRRLRRLAQSTNESRNLEVWRDWVATQARDLTRKQKAGVAWLRARLAAEQRLASAQVRELVARWLPRLRSELRQVTNRGPQHQHRLRRQRAARVVARVIRAELQVLVTQLDKVKSIKDREPAHAARIAAKRVRYLLEPFRGELLGSGTALRLLERLQDILGEVHDAHVFADSLRETLAEATKQRSLATTRQLLPWPSENEAPRHRPAPPGSRTGLLMLARRLRRDGEKRFARLQTEWLRGGGTEQLNVAVRRCASAAAKLNRGGRI